jgi:hypothetical protein
MEERLNLTTEQDRPVLKIDGRAYHLATTNDLRFRDVAYMGWAGKRIQVLGEQIGDPSTYTDEAADEFERVLHKACAMALFDVPEEVYEKLTDNQRMEIMEAFNEAADIPEKEGSRPTESTAKQ